MMEIPYFMTNKEWYRENDDPNDPNYPFGFKLTDKAPPEAVKSFEEYNEQMKSNTKNDNDLIIYN